MFNPLLTCRTCVYPARYSIFPIRHFLQLAHQTPSIDHKCSKEYLNLSTLVSLHPTPSMLWSSTNPIPMYSHHHQSQDFFPAVLNSGSLSAFEYDDDRYRRTAWFQSLVIQFQWAFLCLPRLFSSLACWCQMVAGELSWGSFTLELEFYRIIFAP